MAGGLGHQHLVFRKQESVAAMQLCFGSRLRIQLFLFTWRKSISLSASMSSSTKQCSWWPWYPNHQERPYRMWEMATWVSWFLCISMGVWVWTPRNCVKVIYISAGWGGLQRSSDPWAQWPAILAELLSPKSVRGLVSETKVEKNRRRYLTWPLTFTYA